MSRAEFQDRDKGCLYLNREQIEDVKVLTAILFTPSLLLAQLELPVEFSSENEATPEIFVPAPDRAQGLHNTNGVSELEAIPKIDDLSAADDAILSRLKSRDTRFFNRVAQTEQAGSGASPLEGGPSNLTVSLQVGAGLTHQGQIRNQPIVIDSPAGRLLVPLHAVQEIDFSGGPAATRVLCTSGDFMVGTLVNSFFEVSGIDGSKNRVSTKRCRRLVPDHRESEK